MCLCKCVCDWAALTNWADSVRHLYVKDTKRGGACVCVYVCLSGSANGL